MSALATLATLAALGAPVPGPGAAGGGDEGDRVVLTDGKVLRGRVVFLDERRVVLRQDTRDRELPRSEVERVDARLVGLPEVLAAAAGADDPPELEALARQAEAAGLPGEAAVLWWRLLRAERAAGREHEAARQALGHVRRGKGWLLPVGSRRVDWEKRLELARDWGSAWEFDSFHYRLRTNLPLPEALDLLLDLERLYLAFQDVLGRPLELLDVCTPMHVNVYADAASYPEQASEAGRFDPETDVVHVDASRPNPLWVLAHELTHQLLHDAFFRERRRSGQIPPWVDEGLAEYVSGSVVGFAPLVFVAGKPREVHFRLHAGARDPYDLTRVLALSTGDYLASSGSELKYAQSYTLVHFLLHGAMERFRPGFLEFLRSVRRGQGSATDLRGCLEVRWPELEEEWRAYVRSQSF